MTPKERSHYHAVLWPAACRAMGWSHKDQETRHEVVIGCMEAVRGPLVTTSDAAFGRDEVTALFCYLEHLADPASLDKSARWVTCQQDYKTYNRARQADWHERKLYGSGKNKFSRNRFRGAKSASGGPLDSLDREEVRQRHMSMASRHQKKNAEGQDNGRAQIFSQRRAGKKTGHKTKGGPHAPEPVKPATTQQQHPAPVPAGAGSVWVVDAAGTVYVSAPVHASAGSAWVVDATGTVYTSAPAPAVGGAAADDNAPF
ncbi:MAG: hypothetical protein NTV51_10580 [Verrucomicrobia bacterium]|nr:hypothetical protein [Verrucomicrobiota bacterium]